MSDLVSERLIQRCVDNELTEDERCQLLRQLDGAPDGWKSLACTYMEEQLFAAAIVDSDEKTAARLAPGLMPSPAGKQNWFHHSKTSIALSACVAFLLGILISGEFRSPAATEPVIAEAGAGKIPIAQKSTPSRATVGQLAANDAGYRVRLESDDGTLSEVPVYSDRSRHRSEYELKRQQFRKSLGADLIVEDADPQIRFIRLPSRNGRTILVPIESIFVTPRFQ